MKQLSRYIKPHLLYIIFTLSIKFAATYAELWIPTLMETNGKSGNCIFLASNN